MEIIKGHGSFVIGWQPRQVNEMNAIFKGAAGFVIGYLFFMLPTYVLPYFGSNSAIVGAIGAAVGRGFTPQFWLHAWCLIMLVLVSSIRGKNIGKGWLLVLPVLAGFFDLVPVLNLIPLVPTVMHLLALVLGAIGSAAVAGDTETPSPPHKGEFSWEPWAAGLMSLSAISGTFHFVSGAKGASKQAEIPISPAVSSPKPGSAAAQAVTNASPKSKTQIAESSQPTQAAVSTTSGAQMPKPVPYKPQAQKPSSPDDVSRAPDRKKTEEKPTVRYIDVNN